MRIHKEGKNVIFCTVILLLISNLIIYSVAIHILIQSFYTLFSVFFLLWILYFFRNPPRECIKQDTSIIAPADGKVIAIKKTYEEEYFREYKIKISIFMSPFNIHVNRNPISGVVKYCKYHPGKHLIAFHPKSSIKNERTTTVVEQGNFAIMYRQIAGLLARRIKIYIKKKDPVIQGKEFGFIKFGSRVDVFLPLNVDIKVKLNQKTKGGITILAEKKPQ